MQAWLAAHATPPYRLAQVRRWLFEKRTADFEQMSDLSKPLRQQLGEEFQIWTAQIAAHRQAADGTEKLLLELERRGADRVRALARRPRALRDLHQYASRLRDGLRSCASGIDGVVRNLARGEILEQMLQLQRLLRPEERLSHVVVMGMGEPLANLDRLLPALSQATALDGLGIGARRITISTVGLPEGVRRMADLNLQYHLAVSLHAPNDSLRNELVPANRRIGIAAVMAAADEYFEKTGRRVTFEYVLLGGVNDATEHARQLVALLRGRPSLVNLILYNPVVGLPFRTPTDAAATQFAAELVRGGLTVHVRRRKGERIDAACGQLRRSIPGKGRAEEAKYAAARLLPCLQPHGNLPLLAAANHRQCHHVAGPLALDDVEKIVGRLGSACRRRATIRSAAERSTVCIFVDERPLPLLLAHDLEALQSGPLGRAAGGQRGDQQTVVGLIDPHDARLRPPHVAVGDQLRHDAGDRVDGDGEAHAGALARLAGDGRVHADHAAMAVQERPAGIARIDRRVDLNDRLDASGRCGGWATSGSGWK